MSISKHVLVMACVLVPSLVVSAMPQARPVVQGVAPAAVLKEIKSALDSNLPARVLQVLQDYGLGVNAQLTGDRKTALHLAAELGKMQVVETLLGHGARVNVRDNEGKSPLAYAQASKHAQLAELLQVYVEEELVLLENKKTSEAQDLFEAAKNNDRASVELLLAKGADPMEIIEHEESDYEQLDFKTPFHVAFDAEHYSLAAFLLKEAQGINGFDEHGWTPLMIAIMANDWDLVREFIKDGANLFAGHKEDALDVAEMMESEAKLVKVFVNERGIDAAGASATLKIRAGINGGDKHGWTPLMWAISADDWDLVRELIREGARLGVVLGACKKYNALWIARLMGSEVKLIKAFVAEHGVETDIEGIPLLKGAACGGYIDTVKYLVEQGADIHAQDGNMALMYIVRQGEMDVVKLLVEHGADIHARDNTIYFKTLLMNAAKNGHTGIVKYLVDLGADLNALDSSGSTALVWAIIGEHTDMVKYLVDLGADINARGIRGRTALMWAVMGEDTDIVKYLVEQGASINIQNKYGETALTIAEEEGNQDIIDILRTAQEQQALKPAA